MYGILILDLSKWGFAMDEHDIFGSFDDYLAWAAEETDVDKQMAWLEKALAADSRRVEDVLRVAVGSQNLSARTSGKAYIEELRRIVRNKKGQGRRKRKRSD